MITATYQDQHTPAIAGFFVLAELGGMMRGAHVGRLRIEHNQLLTWSLYEQQPIAKALYRYRAHKARAAVMAVTCTDEAMCGSAA